MSYRRIYSGDLYFFTLALANRQNTTLTDQIQNLRAAFKQVKRRHPFEIIAIVVLPEHLHCIWQLPNGDRNYPMRWRQIKSAFSRSLAKSEPIYQSKKAKRERGIWQRRYWEHCIRDDEDLRNHIDYIHYNPVKHGYTPHARDWPYSSFHKYVREGILSEDWGVAPAIEREMGE